MAKLPKLRHCIIAEQIHPGSSNNPNIVGFFGVSPQVEITFQTFPANMNIAAMILCDLAENNERPDLHVSITGPSGSIMPFTPVEAEAKLGIPIACVVNFEGMPVSTPGKYTVVFQSEGATHSLNDFYILQREG